MLKKRVSRDNLVKVTFALPPETADDSVHVVGSFNGWEGTPLERQRDGTWKITVSLEPGREYEFRYLADNQRWLNEPTADRHVGNPYGEDNSVIAT